MILRVRTGLPKAQTKMTQAALSRLSSLLSQCYWPFLCKDAPKTEEVDVTCCSNTIGNEREEKQ